MTTSIHQKLVQVLTSQVENLHILKKKNQIVEHNLFNSEVQKVCISKNIKNFFCEVLCGRNEFNFWRKAMHFIGFLALCGLLALTFAEELKHGKIVSCVVPAKAVLESDKIDFNFNDAYWNMCTHLTAMRGAISFKNGNKLVFSIEQESFDSIVES